MDDKFLTMNLDVDVKMPREKHNAPEGRHNMRIVGHKRKDNMLTIELQPEGGNYWPVMADFWDNDDQLEMKWAAFCKSAGITGGTLSGYDDLIGKRMSAKVIHKAGKQGGVFPKAIYYAPYDDALVPPAMTTSTAPTQTKKPESSGLPW